MRHIALFILGLILITPVPAHAIDAVYTGFFSSRALEGYDTVSYFQGTKPVEGKDEYQVTWKGAKWLFSSQENLQLFIDNPEKYAPQYGGYCAYAMSFGETASGDPEQWDIRDGKLYINYSARIRKEWQKDPEGYIELADKEWPKLEKEE